MKSPFPLAALSNELLYMILYYVVPSDLVNLCCIQIFHDVAQDLLYQNFNGDGRNLPSFLRTILFNQKLASRVRKVYLGELYMYPGTKLSRYWIDLFTRHIVQLDVSERVKQRWIQHISRGYGEALAALLLTRLPQIEKLDICTFDLDLIMKDGFPPFLPQKKPFWTLMMPKPTGSLFKIPFLRNVHTLNLPDLRCSACDMAAAFALPALRVLHVSQVVETRRDQGLPTWAFLPRSSNISTLTLTSATLSLQTLSRVLLSCTALEHFAYNAPTDSQVTRGFDLLINALSPFHKTLKTLTFLDQNPWSKKISPIHSLAQFSKLERFSSNTSVLMDKNMIGPALDIFPESLREMLLVDPFPSMMNRLGDFDCVLEVFAEAKLTCLPHLAKVDLLVDWDEFLCDEDFSSETFFKNGVELCIRAESFC